MDEQLLNVSNSNKVKTGEVKKTSVQPPQMKGKVKVKKRNGLVKFAEAFLPEDVSDVKGYILVDVVIPSIKKIIDEIFHIILWGDSGASYSRKPSSFSRASYQNYYDRRRSQPDSTPKSESSVFVMDYDFTFEFEEQARDLLNWMMETIRENGLVRLSEVKEEIGISSPWTESKYGWTNLNGFKIIDTHRMNDERWVLKLPKPFNIE